MSILPLRRLLCVSCVAWMSSCGGTPALIKSPAPAQPPVLDGELLVHCQRAKYSRYAQDLQRKPARLHARTDKGLTALHIAAEKNSIDFVRPLVQAGLDINAVDKQGRTALAIAFYSGAMDVASELILLGAKMDGLDEQGRNLWHHAAFCGRPQAWELASRVLPSSLDPKLADKKGLTPLHLAAMRQSKHFIAGLIQLGADANAVDLMGHTPLMSCAGEGTLDSSAHELLLPLTTDVTMVNEVGQDALHLAARQGRSNVIKDLLATGKFKIDKISKDGLTSLHYAVQSGSLAAVKALLAAKADPNIGDKDGVSPLLSAFFWKNPDLIAAIIDGGADLCVVDKGGRTPLHEAAFWGAPELCDLFRRANPASLHMRDREGMTPLLRACSQQHADIVAMLLRAGARTDTPARNGSTALAMSLAGDDHDCRVLEMLLRAGADVKQLCAAKDSILHEAVRSNAPRKIAMLLQYGADPQARDTIGRTPDQLGRELGFPQAVRALRSPRPAAP